VRDDEPNYIDVDISTAKNNAQQKKINLIQDTVE